MASDLVQSSPDQVERVMEKEGGALLAVLVMVVLGVAGIFAISV